VPPEAQPTTEPSRALGTVARVEHALSAELGRGIVARLHNGEEMQLAIRPNGLGDLEVRVAVRDGSVHASIATPDEEARQLLSSQRGDLEAALQRNNLRLDSFSVDVGGREARSFARQDSSHAEPAPWRHGLPTGEPERDAERPVPPPDLDRGLGVGLSLRV
jgi:hypothetical protein